MSDPQFKFCDAAQTAVFRIWPDGRGESHSTAAAEYKEWLAAGNATLPADAVSTVPVSVSPLQARRALRQAGLIDKVDAVVAAATPDIQDAWQYASAISRTDPFVAALGLQLNLSPDAIDDLFRKAALL